MKRNTGLIFLLCLFVYFTAQAQYQNVRIDNFSSANEPSIWINPKNPLEMMAGSNLNFWYYSEDGGETWTSDILTSSEYGVWGDPVIITDTTGDFYFFHLSNPPAGNWIDRIVCQKYNKESGSWNVGTYMGLNGTKAQDKHWAVVDPQTNAIYVTWTQFDQYGSSSPDCQSNIMFSKSVDAGFSWSPAIQINEVSGDCIDSDNTTEGAVPAVGPNGEIYVSWAGPAGIVFDRSLDGGQTWLDQDIFITDQIGGWDFDIPGISRSNGMPVTVCDLSNGPNNGTIYVNFADQRFGANDTDVWLVKSTDGGNSWSEPLRVNDDPPGNQQFFTWMAIDQTTGYLYVVFYDRRNHDDNNTDVYLAVSTDGGDSFNNIQISESPFIPWENVFFGDYNNISVTNNLVRPIWVRMDNGTRKLYTALIDMAVGAQEHAAIPFSMVQNFPNPFSESTVFSYKLKEPGIVSIKVFDRLGKKVADIANQEPQDRGKYEFRLHASELGLKAGVYIIELRSTHQSLHHKLIVAND